MAKNTDVEKAVADRRAEYEKKIRDLSAEKNRLEDGFKMLAAERNSLLQKQQQVEFDRRQLALDRAHVSTIAAEISRLARTI